MGYELDKLMRQFGVSSATLPAYTGYTDQDRNTYNEYVNQYKGRLAGTSQYDQPQFQTQLSPASASPRGVLNAPVFSPSVAPVAPVTPVYPTGPFNGGGGGFYDQTNYGGYNTNLYTDQPILPRLDERDSYRFSDNNYQSIEPTPYIPERVTPPSYPLISPPVETNGMGYAQIYDSTPYYNYDASSNEQSVLPYAVETTPYVENVTAPTYEQSIPPYTVEAAPYLEEAPVYNRMDQIAPAYDYNVSPSITDFHNRGYAQIDSNQGYSDYQEPVYQVPQTPYVEQPAYFGNVQDYNQTVPASLPEPPFYGLDPNQTVNYSLPELSYVDYSPYFEGLGDANYEQLYMKKGGAVKKFAVGGLNDLAAGYGIEQKAGISMLPGSEEFQYGPRPERGPLGPWFEEVATEIVPGVGVAGRARTPERNREVGGVPDSYHLTDDARDFRPPAGMTQGQLLAKLKREFGPDFDVLPSKGRSVHVEPGPNLRRGKMNAVTSAPAAQTELEPVAPAAWETPMSGGRFDELKMLLDGYRGESVYAEELKSARAKAAEEADAFKTMLEASLESPEDAKASKAEMYFRLAAAFGSPTKTGSFGENLSLASGEMAEYSKGRRESAQQKLGTRLKLQEMRMGAAKEDLATLRALSAEEMKDRRATEQALIKEYIESGKPQSAAGKQALDEGLKPGTPKFQARVTELAALDVARETAQLQAVLGNLDINRRREEREERKGEKLTPQELTLKRETEDSLASINSAMELIRKAYALNPNTFDTSAVDMARRKALEIAGSEDPKLVNTRSLENLLKSQMISSAAEKMKGVLSDSDIKLLLDIQGLDAKSVKERANILRYLYSSLMTGRTRQQQRLKDVSSGAYRQVSGE